jgi:hypothetical protein
MQAIYTQDSVVVLWKDNKPVYMASNVVDMEPLKECRRYSKQDKGYIPIPQPQINFAYNQSMGGVDLVDNSEKNYAITSRVKKWYWALYAWFLNIAMVQAWRLYRAHMAEQHRKAIMEEKMQDEEFEKEMAEGDYTKVTIDRRRKEREKQSKQRRAEEKKAEKIPLLEFTRQVVEMTIQKHAVAYSADIVSQKEATAKLTPGALEEVRFDSGRHLIKLTDITGVCKHCKKRSKFRCERCGVALHAECFFNFHVSEEEQE